MQVEEEYFLCIDVLGRNKWSGFDFVAQLPGDLLRFEVCYWKSY